MCNVPMHLGEIGKGSVRGLDGHWLETTHISLQGSADMEIWVRVTWVNSDVDTVTRGREYRVLGFNNGNPIVLDDESDFITLDEDVGYVVVSTGGPTKREPSL